MPGQSTTLVMDYTVPKTVANEIFIATDVDNGTEKRGSLALNRPDVGISGIKIVREEDGERDVQVTLYNALGIPLANSGKTVKLAFYKDGNHKQQIGDTVVIPSSAYADIDEGKIRKIEYLSDWASRFCAMPCVSIPILGIFLYFSAC